MIRNCDDHYDDGAGHGRPMDTDHDGTFLRAVLPQPRRTRPDTPSHLSDHSPLPPSSFPNFFRLLRHTSLLCGAPAGSATSRMLLKCMWAGKEFECGDIFTPVPTDSGMCCAFNPRTILR